MKIVKKNRKELSHNKRNFFLNRFYKRKIQRIEKALRSGLRILSSLLSFKKESKNILKIYMVKLLQTFFCYLDKAIKKNVIHKNKAKRKKSILTKLFYIFFS